MSNPRSNRAITHLLEHLNAAEFASPGTSLADRLRGPRQEFKDLLPTGLAFPLKSHDSLMQPDDGVSF